MGVRQDFTEDIPDASKSSPSRSSLPQPNVVNRATPACSSFLFPGPILDFVRPPDLPEPRQPWRHGARSTAARRLPTKQSVVAPPYWIKTWSYLSFLEGIRELTLKFSGFTVDSLGVDSIKGHSQVLGMGFLTTGPRIEAGNVVTHMGIIRNVTVSCSLCAIICNELFTDRHRCPGVLCVVVMLMGYVVNWNSMSMDYKVLMLCKLKSVVGILVMELCRGRIKSPRTSPVRVQRGADRRGARRMREDHMDASGFLYASADVFCYSLFSLSERVMNPLAANNIHLQRPSTLLLESIKLITYCKQLMRKFRDFSLGERIRISANDGNGTVKGGVDYVEKEKKYGDNIGELVARGATREPFTFFK
ncbi:ty3-gypsy retrotransposon protein [Cucumis melo var. makuwa]|uniref:Ty3-gypsy retrotransposon protein n=1 Tax=Cucumis melo var. makuwa TaxID=1194695 RepID=A0A5D3DYA5_CUCMM|nr:ty3-gypsy retrotransposon protein [Cucumis melo var. makuwa]TYK28230.1 ty3-gypsy retrotransposon protein [Cucumis melo var. makuwa]